jgi:hypothetical protein
VPTSTAPLTVRHISPAGSFAPRMKRAGYSPEARCWEQRRNLREDGPLPRMPTGAGRRQSRCERMRKLVSTAPWVRTLLQVPGQEGSVARYRRRIGGSFLQLENLALERSSISDCRQRINALSFELMPTMPPASETAEPHPSLQRTSGPPVIAIPFPTVCAATTGPNQQWRGHRRPSIRLPRRGPARSRA